MPLRSWLLAVLLVGVTSSADARWPGFGGVASISPSMTNSVRTLGLDTATSGAWLGHYGADGYVIPGVGTSLPNYATASVNVGPNTQSASGDTRVLQQLDGSYTTYGAWGAQNRGNTFAIDIHVTDGRAHKVTLYTLGLIASLILQKITITDPDTSAVLSTQVSTDANGVYLSFLVSGHIVVTFEPTVDGSYAILSGILFDPAVPATGLSDYAIANSGGAAVPLNITTPSEQGASLATSVASLPTNGTVTLADGTPVTVSESLSLAQLAGLKVTPSTLSTTAASPFTYTVSDGAHATTGSLPIVVEVIPTPPVVSSCTAAGYEQAGLVTSDSGPMSVLVPKTGVLPSETGVLVNDADLLSVISAQYYVAKHGIPSGNVIHINYPIIRSDYTNYSFDVTTFNAILAMIPSNIQMIAMAWNEPFNVVTYGHTNALGSAIFYNTYWSPTSGSPAQPGWSGFYYSNYWYDGTLPTATGGSTAPFTDFSVRPNMYMTGLTLADALALIDRGATAQTTMPTGTHYFINTTDSTRSLRFRFDEIPTTNYWTNSGAVAAICKDNNYLPYSPADPCTSNGGSDYITGANNVLVMQGGWTGAPIFGMTTNTYVPGSEVDTVTSDAGTLLPTGAEGKFEGSILEILQDGATGSYGWSGEPSANGYRFTNSGSLTQQYFSGRTLGEAMYLSVADPGNSNSVGDPLARPWGSIATFSSGTFALKTTIMHPSNTTTFSLKAASSCGGPYTTLQSGIHPDVDYLKFKTITDGSGFHPFYMLTSP